MNKIKNYVLQGRGIGAIWLFAFALLLSLWVAHKLNVILPQSVPYIQQLADDALPIKIKNGHVVEPQNEVKLLSYTVLGAPFTVGIDTTKDVLEEGKHAPGLYLTKSYLYTVSDKEIRRQDLVADLDLPKQDYTPAFNKVIRWIVGSVAVLGPVLAFFYFLIGVLLYAFCTGLACFLNKNELTFKAKMRLNTVLFIGVLPVCQALLAKRHIFAVFLPADEKLRAESTYGKRNQRENDAKRE